MDASITNPARAARTQPDMSSFPPRDIFDLSGVDVFERQGPSSASWQPEERNGNDDGSSSDEEGAEPYRGDRMHNYGQRHESSDDNAEPIEDLDDYANYAQSSSPFTNPSWYGSPSQRRDSVLWDSRRASSTGAGPSSSAATSPITSPPASKMGMTWGSGTQASPRPNSGAKWVRQSYPRQVTTYYAAMLKIRALQLEEEEEENDVHTSQNDSALRDPQPPPIEKDEAPDNMLMSMSGLGSLLPRRWTAAGSSTAAHAPQQYATNAATAKASLDYAPTAAAAFDDMPTYRCATCGITLALQDELISKAFSGRDGKAFLFFSVLNARAGAKEDRHLITGLHTVADLTCASCDRNIGWTYVRAYEASQRYKEGKFILERASLHKSNHW